MSKDPLYLELLRNDILDPLSRYLEDGDFWIDAKTKKITWKKVINWKVPWVYIKHHKGNNCFLWRGILFECFKNKMGNPPFGCQKCWKVCVKMTKLTDLFKFEEMARKMNYPSKCGMEARPLTNHLYGGYFYCKTVKEGLERYNEVRKAIDETFSPEMSVILRRGCTDMENHFGPSDKWVVTDEVLGWEDKVTALLDKTKHHGEQPKYIQNNVKIRWIRFAYQYGDETYKEFTGGEPLYRGPATYHDIEEKENGESK